MASSFLSFMRVLVWAMWSARIKQSLFPIFLSYWAMDEFLYVRPRDQNLSMMWLCYVLGLLFHLHRGRWRKNRPSVVGSTPSAGSSDTTWPMSSPCTFHWPESLTGPHTQPQRGRNAGWLRQVPKKTKSILVNSSTTWGPWK